MCSCACRPAKEGSSVVCVSEFKFGGGEGEIKTRMVEGVEHQQNGILLAGLELLLSSTY
jgi:hypothetical protein